MDQFHTLLFHVSLLADFFGTASRNDVIRLRDIGRHGTISHTNFV